MITLYQFEFSHFCEKARWALDYKGLAYEVRNLIPGIHRRITSKLAAKTCVPVLIDGTAVVQESGAIISYLDERYPERSLTPEDPDQAEEVLAWERYFDTEIGVPLRLWFYYHVLPDRQRALRFMTRGSPWYGRLYLSAMFSRLRAAMLERMAIGEEAAERAEARVLAACERLNGALADNRFLVGDRFSRADLAACALLMPLCTLDEDALPDQLRTTRARRAGDRFLAWVKHNQTHYRYPSKIRAV